VKSVVVVVAIVVVVVAEGMNVVNAMSVLRMVMQFLQHHQQAHLVGLL
jgi:hypothetical protein